MVTIDGPVLLRIAGFRFVNLFCGSGGAPGGREVKDRLASDSVSHKALSVLVVEDDAVVGILLKETLRSLGHVVCAVERTEHGAIAAAVRWKPDLMIVDVRLGAGSGISAVAQILTERPIPHVFVTGDSLAVRQQMPDAILIEKPFREADLIKAIDRALATGGDAA
jgi:CheY-like chemotaxis protein